jgi:FkbM family methyltransferase
MNDLTSEVSTKYGNVTFLKNDYYIAQSLVQGIIFEEKTIEEHLKEIVKSSKVILDVGAHIGCHSIIYSKINPEATIYAFELQTMMYNILKRNITDNNVHLYNCAIGNKIKMINVNSSISDGPNHSKDFKYDDNKKYNFGGVSVGKNGEEKMMITIDSMNLNGCDYIKIDVEGFEYFVLLGAINTIIKYHPVIFYENNYKKATKDMFELAELDEKNSINEEQLLRSLGYKNITRVGPNILAKYK